jgi:hypothetical protein
MGKTAELRNNDTSRRPPRKAVITELGEQDFLYGKDLNDSNLIGLLQDFHV